MKIEKLKCLSNEDVEDIINSLNLDNSTVTCMQDIGNVNFTNDITHLVCREDNQDIVAYMGVEFNASLPTLRDVGKTSVTNIFTSVSDATINHTTFLLECLEIIVAQNNSDTITILPYSTDGVVNKIVSKLHFSPMPNTFYFEWKVEDSLSFKDILKKLCGIKDE